MWQKFPRVRRALSSFSLAIKINMRWGTCWAASDDAGPSEPPSACSNSGCESHSVCTALSHQCFYTRTSRNQAGMAVEDEWPVPLEARAPARGDPSTRMETSVGSGGLAKLGHQGPVLVTRSRARPVFFFTILVKGRNKAISLILLSSKLSFAKAKYDPCIKKSFLLYWYLFCGHLTKRLKFSRAKWASNL